MLAYLHEVSQSNRSFYNFFLYAKFQWPLTCDYIYFTTASDYIPTSTVVHTATCISVRDDPEEAPAKNVSLHAIVVLFKRQLFFSLLLHFIRAIYSVKSENYALD